MSQPSDDKFTKDVLDYARSALESGSTMPTPPSIAAREATIIKESVILGLRACVAQRLHDHGFKRKPHDVVLSYHPDFLAEAKQHRDSFIAIKESRGPGRLTEVLLEECYAIGCEVAKHGDIGISMGDLSTASYGILPTGSSQSMILVRAAP